MDLVFINLQPTFHSEIGTCGLQYVRSFADQVGIGHCKGAALHSVGGKLRPAETLCNFQRQVPL